MCEGYRAAECPPRGDVDVQEVPRPTAASKLPPMACRNAGSLDCDRGLACTGGSNTTATTAAAAGELPNSVVPTSFFNSGVLTPPGSVAELDCTACCCWEGWGGVRCGTAIGDPAALGFVGAAGLLIFVLLTASLLVLLRRKWRPIVARGAHTA